RLEVFTRRIFAGLIFRPHRRVVLTDAAPAQGRRLKSVEDILLRIELNALIVLTDRFVVVLRLIGIGAGLQDRWQFIVNVFGLLILSRNARPLGGRRVRLFLSFSGVSCCAPTRHSAIVRGFDLVERQGVAVARLKREIVLWMLADLNVGVVVGARARCAGRDCVSADERNADVHVLTILIG